MTSGTVNILLVDDDDIDVEACCRAFARLHIPHPLCIARDGVEAIEILRGENGYTPLEEPYVILLDINMPRMDGLEFLEELRADEQLKRSVVFILTTSSADEDRQRAYNSGVAGYILKNKSDASFLEAVSMIDQYSKVVELPGA
ncbi:MAG: response regulator [Hyphomicrobiales bacterium]|nr:response regulator [Hyphomicrobiales bacterium]